MRIWAVILAVAVAVIDGGGGEEGGGANAAPALQKLEQFKHCFQVMMSFTGC